ncbi:MAG: CsbD family protein [Blastocatellia bacterium]|nr:CsbD family protein [Blastocatellia bacterium]
MWNKDELEGKGKQIKGTIKEKIGEWTGNESLEEEGEAERAAGNAQEDFGIARRKAGEAIEKVGEKVGEKVAGK